MALFVMVRFVGFRCVQLMASFVMGTAMPLQGMVVSAPFALAQPMASSFLCHGKRPHRFCGRFASMSLLRSQLNSCRFRVDPRGVVQQTPGPTQTAVAVSS